MSQSPAQPVTAAVEGRFGGVEVARGGVFDRESLGAAVQGCDNTYYLVHSIG